MFGYGVIIGSIPKVTLQAFILSGAETKQSERLKKQFKVKNKIYRIKASIIYKHDQASVTNKKSSEFRVHRYYSSEGCSSEWDEWAVIS